MDSKLPLNWVISQTFFQVPKFWLETCRTGATTVERITIFRFVWNQDSTLAKLEFPHSFWLLVTPLNQSKCVSFFAKCKFMPMIRVASGPGFEPGSLSVSWLLQLCLAWSWCNEKAPEGILKRPQMKILKQVIDSKWKNPVSIEQKKIFPQKNEK